MSLSPDGVQKIDVDMVSDSHEQNFKDQTLANGHACVEGQDIEDEIDALGEELETLSLPDADLYTCPKCKTEFKQPRVLSCLHVFCEGCLRPLLIEDCIACPTCNKPTEVESVTELPLDYTIANDLDMKGIEGMNMTCTSCKATEKAISRCSDCANFLCPNCVTAHQFMRCFENHKVVSFTDIINQEGMSIHRPIVCNVHGEEQPMKYFCISCQIPICNECIMMDHQAPAHRVERICDIEARETSNMESLIGTAESKVEKCEEVSTNLQQSLSDLESERDDAKSLINETFQSYKAMLEKRRESLLEQMEELHKQQELSVMEMFHEVNNTVDGLEHGTAFVRRILSKSNCLELLSLKKVMSQYMTSLVNKPLRGNVSVDIKFVTDYQKFDAIVNEHFGHFKLTDESVLRSQQQQQQMHQLRQIERNAYRTNIANSANMPNSDGYGIKMGSPPTLMQAPPYSDMSGMFVNPGAPSMMGSPDSGLPNDMRPILSNDYNSGSLYSSANPVSMGMTDQLGLRNASVTSLTGMGAGVIGDQQGVTTQGPSQSPTISDSGIVIDSNGSPSATNAQSPKFTIPTTGATGGMVPGTSASMMQGMPLGVDTIYSSAPGLGPSTASSPDQELNMSRGSGMYNPLVHSRAPMNNPMDAMMMQRRDTPSVSMASGPGTSSGFTSPTPTLSQQYGPSGLPIRSKMSAMQIRHKFGALGPSKSQFNSPHGFCMGFEEDIVVADTNNHRIQVFDKGGDFKYQFGIPGREEGQLWYPRKVAVMRGASRYVICDRGNERSRMQIFSKNGHFVKKIAIRYIDIVAGLAITPAGNIVAVDSVSPTVFTIAESGDLIKWFDCSDYMREPSDIAVADKEYYVCDFKGHCVVVFNDDGQFMRRIGTDTITNFPNGIDISDAGDVLVGDSHGNRFHVAVFQRDGSLIGEFECPYVKVSRCCGLKITSEGYVVTLAKNNHHVLVLNTLYIS